VVTAPNSANKDKPLGGLNTCPHAYLLCAQLNTLHGTEYKITCGVCLCVFLHVHTGFGGRISRKVGWMDGYMTYISKTVEDRGSVRMGHQQEMTKGKSMVTWLMTSCMTFCLL